MNELIEAEKAIRNSDEIQELLQLTNITMRSWIFSVQSRFSPYIKFYFYTPETYPCSECLICYNEYYGKERIIKFLLSRYIIHG